MSHPYQTFLQDFVKALDSGRKMPSGGFASVAVKPNADAPRVLVFAPHPDDECIIGALPLRILRELKYRVGVVAVTQGSRLDRQAPRLAELKGAVGFLGWDLITTKEGGLMKVTPGGKTSDPAMWKESVDIIVKILKQEKPQIIFFPHDKDWNQSHIGTNLLVMDALKVLGPDFKCTVVETEFWAASTAPNVMIESTPEDVADLVAAISFHVEEVARNPYHLLLPSWMSDNVRRGGELVGGQGEAVPNFNFATLYRVSKWDGQSLTPRTTGSRFISAGAEHLASLFN